MVTREREAPIQMIHGIPETVCCLLAASGMAMPDGTVVRLTSERMSEAGLGGPRADVVAVVTKPDGERFTVLIVVQCRTAPLKKRAWPAFMAKAWKSIDAPVILLVLCPDETIAAWAGEEIQMGVVGTVQPLALSPASFPPIGDPTAFTGSIELAVWSAFVHADRPQGTAGLRALMELLGEVKVVEADRFVCALRDALSPRAQAVLIVLLCAGDHEFQRVRDLSPRKVIAWGFGLSGREKPAGAVLNVLTARGIRIDRTVIRRIVDCADSDLLRSWLIRAVTVDCAEDIFG